MIPKKIHYVWVGGNPKPDNIEKCISTWKRLYNDYEIIEWNENNFDINSNEYVKEAYSQKKWAFVSDYIRMWAIYNYGGVYFDTDIIAVKSIDDLLNNCAFVGYENNYAPFTAVFGAEPKHPFIKRILDAYESCNKKFDKNNTNTILVSNILIKEYGCKLGNKDQLLKDGLRVYKKEILCEPSIKSKTIHAYAASWQKKGDRSFLGNLEATFRGHCFSKIGIILFYVPNILLFKPKKWLSHKLGRL